MPVPRSRDPQLARRDFEAWLAAHTGATVSIARFEMPRANGYSSESILVDAMIAGTRHALVARVAPTRYTLFPDYDLTFQRRILETLASTTIPVPRVRWHGPSAGSPFGSEFFVMDRVEGRPAGDTPPYTKEGWLLDAAPADQRTAYLDGLAQVVAVADLDWSALGLDFVGREELGAPGARRQVAYCRGFLDWAGVHRPLFDEAVEWLDRDPPEGQLCFSWGDARPGNLLYRKFRVQGVLDWEMASLCPREADLGYWLAAIAWHSSGHRLAPLAGFPGRTETIALYEQMAGVSVDRVEWWEVLGILKLAMLLARMKKLMEANGVLREGVRPERPAERVLEQYLAR